MSQKKGVFILVAGANASGKSTVIKPNYVIGRVKHYANPDIYDDPDFPVIKDRMSPKAQNAYESGKPDRFAIQCINDWLLSPSFRNEGISTESKKFKS